MASFRSQTGRQAGGCGIFEKARAVPGTWSFQIEKAGIQIHGDVAITHFILQRTVDFDAGAAVKRSSRVTHTWIREDPQWKIIGGMSAEFR